MSTATALGPMPTMTTVKPIPSANYKLRQALVTLEHYGTTRFLTKAEKTSLTKRGFIVGAGPTAAAEAEVERMGRPLKKTGPRSFQEEGISRNITIGSGAWWDRSEFLAWSTDGRHAFVRDALSEVRMIRAEDVEALPLLRGVPS